MSLTPLQLTLNGEAALLGTSPRVDNVITRQESGAWTAAQRARLPDGVRDNAAAHVLLEFKNTESVNETALLQTACYDLFYRQAQNLSEEQVLTAIISAKTPQ
jgi:hypothetical protein